AEFHQSVGTAQSVHQIAIDAYNGGRLSDPDLQRETDRDWFLSLLPERDIEGRWIDRARRERLADTFSKSPGDVLRQCPAMLTECVVTELRAMAGGRKATRQDAFDLMHIIPALAYCDVFVSNDGPLGKQAEETCRRTGRTVAIVST